MATPTETYLNRIGAMVAGRQAVYRIVTRLFVVIALAVTAASLAGLNAATFVILGASVKLLFTKGQA